MIDTVEFRLHNLARHKQLLHYLDTQLKSSGKTIKLAQGADERTPEQRLLFRTLLTYHDTGHVTEVAHFNKLKSSHYEIAYKIDYLRDYIAFNVSVPKYAYGTNILLYLRQVTDPKFQMHKHCDVRYNLTNVYPRLVNFFNKFFTAQFQDIYIDWGELEINRLDLCYNQVFQSKEDAFEYLNQLKKLKKKYSRDTSNFSRDWKTSIMYKTDRYSFKVYHKGSEFAKHDAKRLREINETGAAYFDVPHYQAFADRILRYEMTFRNSYMSYLFMHKLFRADCPVWQYSVDLWKKNKSQRAKANKAKKGEQGKADYIAYRKGLSLSDKQHIEYVENFIHRTKKFYMADKDKNAFDLETNPAKIGASKKERFRQSAVFSRDLCRLMGRKFLSVLDEFKLEMAQDNTSILANLERHNENIRAQQSLAKSLNLGREKNGPRRISVSKIKMLLNLLETHTFEEIEAQKMFSRNTWLNLRKDLETVGVTRNNLLGLALNVRFDLSAYHEHLLLSSHKYRHLTF